MAAGTTTQTMSGSSRNSPVCASRLRTSSGSPDLPPSAKQIPCRGIPGAG
jgi:hypothetical protein